MKVWYSTTELAGLPGIPGTDRGIRIAAQRENWKSQKRAKGKGLEYHIESLPEQTRAHLVREHAVDYVNQFDDASVQAFTELQHTADETAVNERLKVKQDGMKKLAGLPDDHPQKSRAAAREWLLCRLADYARLHKTSVNSVVVDFVNAYNSGEIVIPQQHQEWMPLRDGVRHLHRATLLRWRKAYQEQGLAGLTTGHGKTKGQSKIETNPELKEIVLGLLINNPHIMAVKVKRFLEVEHTDLDVVSLKSIERFMKSWKEDNAQLWTYMTNPDKWKNIYMAAFGSHHEEITYLNQLWEMDSTPADWMLADGRHCVIGAIDMYSRRLKFRVSKTSKAEAVCYTFRDAVIAWGLPDGVRTDNGKDYVSKRFTGVLRDLEIEPRLCMPFASEQKGTIERAMRTMSHGILDLLPGFIGHNVAERKVIEARKSFAQRIMSKDEVVEVSMTAAELQQKLDQWCEYEYGRNEHSGLNGKSPWQVANEWTQPVKRINDERALDVLLAELGGTKTVTKNGIRHQHHNYIDPTLASIIGDDVYIKIDPDDIGRLYVYNMDGEFVCVAKAHKILGINSAEVASAAKAGQKKLLARQRDELKDAKRNNKKNVADLVLQHRITNSANVAELPKPSTDYTTTALNAAGQAARADDMRTNTSDVDMDSFVANFNKPVARVIESDDPQRRYKRWVRIEQRIQSGQAVSDQERDGLTRYKKTDEYLSMQRFFADFSLEVDDAQA